MGAEHLQPPLLSGQPCQHSGLDGGKVSVYQRLPRRSGQRSADQLGQCIRNGTEDPLQFLQPALFHKLPGQRQQIPVNVCSWEVLGLHNASGPAPGPVRPVELQDAANPTIRADCGLYGVVFFRAGLSQLLPDLQHPPGGVTA